MHSFCSSHLSYIKLCVQKSTLSSGILLLLFQPALQCSATSTVVDASSEQKKGLEHLHSECGTCSDILKIRNAFLLNAANIKQGPWILKKDVA